MNFFIFHSSSRKINKNHESDVYQTKSSRVKKKKRFKQANKTHKNKYIRTKKSFRIKSFHLSF